MPGWHLPTSPIENHNVAFEFASGSLILPNRMFQRPCGCIWRCDVPGINTSNYSPPLPQPREPAGGPSLSPSNPLPTPPPPPHEPSPPHAPSPSEPTPTRQFKPENALLFIACWTLLKAYLGALLIYFLVPSSFTLLSRTLLQVLIWCRYLGSVFFFLVASTIFAHTIYDTTWLGMARSCVISAAARGGGQS